MPRIKLTILDREYPFEVSDEDVENLQIAFDSITGRLGQVPVDEATVSRVAALRMKCDEALDPALEG